MRGIIAVIGVVAIVTPWGDAAAGRGSESAFEQGYQAGSKIGDAHPASPAAQRTLTPPEKHAKQWERGWRQGAYDRHVKWLKRNGRKRHELPTMAEVFDRPAARAREPERRAPVSEPGSSPSSSGGRLAIPSSGSYRMTLPEGSLMMWAPMYYESLGNGMYRIRSGSGGGGPNPFDRGTVVDEAEMYKILVREGALER